MSRSELLRVVLLLRPHVTLAFVETWVEEFVDILDVFLYQHVIEIAVRLVLGLAKLFLGLAPL